MPETATDTALAITSSAEQVIGDMQRRVSDVAMFYGRLSGEHVGMLESLTRAMAGMMRLGGTLYRDTADLSLFGSSWIAYGVIFHPVYKTVDGKTVRDELLGEWSIHS